jgi:uncharacterized protein YecE (DUF72 family)
MAGEIRIGTCGWNYPSGKGTWNGIFYPAPRPRGFDELAFYAEHFDTVEVNSTFYRMPEAPQTSRWVERTPVGFLFTVKLYQQFTHPDMYLARGGVADWNPSRTDIDLFRAGIDPLAAAGRLGAVMIQFPPSFHAQDETREYLDWLVAAFAEYPVAVELRHKSWSDASRETTALLSAHRAAWVLIDEPKFASSIVQPAGAGASDAGASPLTYIRLHGRNAEQWWGHAESEDRYNYLYSPDELEPFAERVETADRPGRPGRVRSRLPHGLSRRLAKLLTTSAQTFHQLARRDVRQ